MTTKQINRALLLKIAGLVRPALASADYIPALTHILFDRGFATAYNDISAIVVQAPVDIGRCIPGDLLIRALGSFSGEMVALAFDDKTNALLVTSGRSKIKLPTMAPSDFPFEVPGDTAPEVTLTQDILKAIDRCLLSAGTDATHPAQMGVTLETDDAGNAVLYSTDNVTISRCATRSPIELPGGTPVILPKFLCEQIGTLARAHPNAEPVLVLLPGGLLVDYMAPEGAVASLFSKTVVDLAPIDFPMILARFLDPVKVRSSLVKIPDALDAAFGRSLLVLSQEVAKTTTMSVSGKVLTLVSDSAMGQSDDEVPFDHADVSVKVDPALVVRGLKQCAKMLVTKKVMVLGDDTGDFLHLISYVA